jgi:uncharacterized membrane protein YGL010W
MTKKLKRIGPVKFGLILGIIYGLISLIMVPFFLLAIVISAFAPHTDAAQQGIGIGVGIAMCVFLPIFYAVIGGLFGMLAAVIYNLVAGWTGGIEFEVE